MTAKSTKLPAEPRAHATSRRLQRVIRGLIAAFLIATIVCLAFYRPVAYLAAIPVLVLGVFLVVIDHLERRSRALALRRPGHETPSEEEVEIDVETAGFATALRIAGVLAVAAVVVAASFFEWRMVGIVAAGVFLYLVLLGFPFWIAAVHDSAEEEREEATGRSGG